MKFREIGGEIDMDIEVERKRERESEIYVWPATLFQD